jgi:hypothetical protein
MLGPFKVACPNLDCLFRLACIQMETKLVCSVALTLQRKLMAC